MADNPTIRWRNQKLSSLTNDELVEAMEFCRGVYEETRGWAPVSIWAFFSTILADLTIEKAKRIGGSSPKVMEI